MTTIEAVKAFLGKGAENFLVFENMPRHKGYEVVLCRPIGVGFLGRPFFVVMKNGVCRVVSMNKAGKLKSFLG